MRTCVMTKVCDVFFFEHVLELIGVHKRIRALSLLCVNVYSIVCVCVCVCVGDVLCHTTKRPVLLSDIF